MSTSSPSHQVPDLTFRSADAPRADVPPAESPAPTPPVIKLDDPRYRPAPRARPTMLQFLAGGPKTWSGIWKAENQAMPRVIESMEVAPQIAAKRAENEGKIEGLPKSAAIGIAVLLLGLTFFVFWKAIHMV